MNRMTRPSASLISLRTALRRSSNSPRNLAPAMSAPRSSATTRLSLSVSGTSPRTIRWARPSAMAVLPTPGSPMRTGLFLVRRRQDLDDAPDLLVAADDRVELAGAGLRGEVAAVLLQRLVGALGVRRWSRAGRRGRSGGRPGSPRGRRRAARGAAGASPPTSADAEEQVLRGDVLVAEAPRLLLGALDDPPGARIERELSRPGSGRAGRGPRRARRGTRRGPRRAGGASRRGCRRRARRGRRAGAPRRARGSASARRAAGRRGWPPGPSG